MITKAGKGFPLPTAAATVAKASALEAATPANAAGPDVIERVKPDRLAQLLAPDAASQRDGGASMAPPGRGGPFAVRDLFLAAKTAGKVPWTAATVNRFMERAMKPVDYPAAFADFKGWATTTFLLDAAQRAELETISEAGLAQLRKGAAVAAKVGKPLEFRVRTDSATSEPLRIDIGDIAQSEKKTKVGVEKSKVWGVVLSYVEIAVAAVETPASETTEATDGRAGDPSAHAPPDD